MDVHLAEFGIQIYLVVLQMDIGGTESFAHIGFQGCAEAVKGYLECFFRCIGPALGPGVIDEQFLGDALRTAGNQGLYQGRGLEALPLRPFHGGIAPQYPESSKGLDSETRKG